MGNVLFAERQQRRERREHGVAVVGAAAAVKLVVLEHGRPRAHAFGPAGHLGLLVEMAIHEHRAGRLSRHVDQNQRRAVRDLDDLQRRAGQFGNLAAHPFFEQCDHLGHVAVLVPIGIEYRRFVGDADVIGQHGDNVLVPQAAHEAGQRCVVHGSFTGPRSARRCRFRSSWHRARRSARIFPVPPGTAPSC